DPRSYRRAPVTSDPGVVLRRGPWRLLARHFRKHAVRKPAPRERPSTVLPRTPERKPSLSLPHGLPGTGLSQAGGSGSSLEVGRLCTSKHDGSGRGQADSSSRTSKSAICCRECILCSPL